MLSDGIFFLVYVVYPLTGFLIGYMVSMVSDFPEFFFPLEINGLILFHPETLFPIHHFRADPQAQKPVLF